MGSCENISDFMMVGYIASRITTRPIKSLTIMLSCFVIIGLLGNSLVIYVHVAKKNKLSSTVFIIALACNDLLTSAIAMPYTMVVEDVKYQGMADFSCKFYHFVITCTVPFSVFILVAIAIDRYLCICRPHCNLLNYTRACNIVIALLPLSITLGVITAMIYGVYIDLSTFRKHDVIEESAEVATNGGMDNMTDILTNLEKGNCHKCVTFSTKATFTHSLKKIVYEFYTTLCSPQNLIKKASIYTGYCHPNEIIFSDTFMNIYKIIYFSIFLFCFFVIFVLYILIYWSVLVRRARRLEDKIKTKRTNTSEKSLTQNQTDLSDSPVKRIFILDTSIWAQGISSCSLLPTAQHIQDLSQHIQDLSQHIQDLSQHIQVDDHKLEPKTKQKKRSQKESNNGCEREKYYLANIRTTIMLFVVVVAFVIAYLPSWLMSFEVISINIVIFYVYFSIHIVNPIIYAFMNPAFRKSLQGLMCGKKPRFI